MPVLDCPIQKQDWVHQEGSIQEIAQRNGAAVPRSESVAAKPIACIAPWDLTVQKIAGFQHLADDWDGGGAKAPTRELLESAFGLACIFSDRGVNAPHRVAPGVDGSVIFEWQEPDGTYADVEVVRPFFAEVMTIEPGQPAKHFNIPTVPSK